MNNSDQECSDYFIDHGIPLLIQPRAIRILGGGQVDYCFIRNKNVFLIESKYSLILSQRQKIRLKKSANLISSILEYPVYLYLFVRGKVFRVN